MERDRNPIDMSILTRIDVLLEEQKEDLPILLKNVKDRDPRGVATASLMGAYRFMAVAEYLVNKNVNAFRQGLSTSAEYQEILFERFKSGEDISYSYVSMTSGYQSLLNALAAANMKLSNRLALLIGGRETIERENDHSFDRAFGYALKAAVLQTSDLGKRVADLATELSKGGNGDFLGYAEIFALCASGAFDNVERIFSKILQGHRKQSKGKGVFKGTPDEALCVWGVAVANLLILRGGHVDMADESIFPKNLILIDPQQK